MENPIQFSETAEGLWQASVISLPQTTAYGVTKEEAEKKLRAIRPDIPVSRRKEKLRLGLVFLSLLAGLFLGFLSFDPWFRVWLLIIPDCPPHTMGGQCGLASAIDVLCAIPCALLTVIAMTIVIYRVLNRRSHKRAL